MPPAKRMTANPVRPARHRPGKDTGHDSSDLDTDDSAPEDNTPALPPPPKAVSAGKIVTNLGKTNLGGQKKETVEVTKQSEKLVTTQGSAVEDTEKSSDGAREDDDEDEGDSSEEESSSEDETPRRMMMRPKFIPRNQRDTKDPEEEAEAVRLAEEAARKKAADELVEEQIKKDLAARAAGKKHWDDDEGSDSDVDTTDGLDPEAEEAAWRVRELRRLRRARLAIEEREKELEEVERRRNLTEEERRAEDEAFLAKQRGEKDGRGKMSYMQKYFHKGAFFQEATAAAGLLQRDIMGSRIQDDVRNRESLPDYLQRRDMTKLGRKGGTKYKDMRTEDTGSWGRLDDGRGRKDARFRTDDERFQADDDAERFRGDGDRGPKGANMIPLGERRRNDRRREDKGDRYRGDSYRSSRNDNDNDSDKGKRRSRSPLRSRSRSRSRSPRRDRSHNEYRRRKRSTSRGGERYEGDKRRRVDAHS